MAIGPDGNLYVTESNTVASRVLKFGRVNADGLTRNFLGNAVTPITSYGLVHPYYLTFDPLGNLYMTAQNTNIVLRVFGPNSPLFGTAMPLSTFLQENYPNGIFAPGTFIPASTARPDVPPFTSVPTTQGGLTLLGPNSVRGMAFGPNHTVYVADQAHNRVAVYDSDSGALLQIVADSHTQLPVQVFYNIHDGLIYIGCPGSNRIQRYDPNTNILSDFIHDSTHLGTVSGIAFGEDGNFYAANRSDMKIYKYDSSGSFIGQFGPTFTDSPEGIMPVYDTYP